MPEGAHPLGHQRADCPRAALALLGQLIAFAGALALSCDQGEPTDASGVGPPIHLVASNVDAAHKLPPDGKIVLTFDRLLLPLSVTRQSLALRDAFNQAPSSPIVVYDPVALTVTISNPSPGQPWLLEDQPYKVILPVPKDANDIGGLRAMDNATLDHTYVVAFFTGSTPRAFTPYVPKHGGALDLPGTPPIKPTYCHDVQPIFDSHCGTAGQCHNATDHNDAGAYPPMGMLLTTAAGIRNTAIGRASEEMNRAASSAPLAPGKHFGVNMPIIDPGNPGNSYLVYKFLAHGPTTSPAITDDEAARLHSLIAGQAMPPPFVFKPNDDKNYSAPLQVEEAETISAWIAQGAAVDDCQ